MELPFVAALLAFALLLQIFATLRVRGSKSYASDQKSAQFKLIWMLPVLGAATVLAVMYQDGELTKSRDNGSQQNRGGNGRV